jgi:hypothetical protein
MEVIKQDAAAAASSVQLIAGLCGRRLSANKLVCCGTLSADSGSCPKIGGIKGMTSKTSLATSRSVARIFHPFWLLHRVSRAEAAANFAAMEWKHGMGRCPFAGKDIPHVLVHLLPI